MSILLNLYFYLDLRTTTKQIFEQIQLYIKTIRPLRIPEKKLSKVSIQILMLLKHRGRLTISEIEALTKANRSTLKNRLNELIERNMIERHGKGPATWYTLA